MKSDISYQKVVDETVSLTESPRPPRYISCVVIITWSTIFLVVSCISCWLMVLSTSPPVPHLCNENCRLVLVESIPVGVSFNSSVSHPSIYQSWLDLISEARSSLDIASFYWTLTNEDTHTHEPTASQGEKILQELINLSGRIPVRIAVNSAAEPQADLQKLITAGAGVRSVNLSKLTSGVLHTKFWVVDKRHIYIGSANMDWRSLTQVKELGVVVYDCGCLAEDLLKIFEAYWFLGDSQVVPPHWPSQYSTTFNKDTPMQLSINGSDSKVYLSSSPPALCADGRTGDLQAILSVISDAQKFVDVAVMNYLPVMEYSSKRYWSDIDTQLRRVAYERRVRVRLLVSCWNSSSPVMFPFLRSLSSLHEARLDVQVKIFIVPADSTQTKIPFSRVNHNKYMVTDKVAYIGTSNWSGDYFVHTAGSALVVNQSSSSESMLKDQLQSVFERDWNSDYSTLLHPNSNIRDICNLYPSTRAAVRPS